MWLSEGVNVLGRCSVRGDRVYGGLYARLSRSERGSASGFGGRVGGKEGLHRIHLLANGQRSDEARRGPSGRDRQFLPGVTWVAACEGSTLFYW